VSGARCAERANAAGARGRINKIAGVLITAIPFGSAARRCSWENGIFCYQMTVRLRLFVRNAFVSRTVADSFSAASEKPNDVKRVRNCGGVNRRAKCSIGGLGLSVGRPHSDIPSKWPIFEWIGKSGRDTTHKRSVVGIGSVCIKPCFGINLGSHSGPRTASLAARFSLAFSDVLCSPHLSHRCCRSDEFSLDRATDRRRGLV